MAVSTIKAEPDYTFDISGKQQLTKGNDFLVSKDGYIRVIYSNSSSNKYCRITSKQNSNYETLFLEEKPTSSRYQSTAIFVKKGMTVRWESESTNESVYYYPLS